MRSLERALNVLTALEQRARPLRLTEVAAETELHVATTQRILQVLERRGLVARHDSRYQLGVATVPLAHTFLVGNPLSRAATPVLQELAAATGLTASLFVRHGWNRVVIGRVQGAHPLRYVLPIGEQLPLHVGAGRVLAAAAPPDEVEALLTHVGEVRFASGELLSRDQFLRQLEEIRQTGFHVARSERVPGVSSVTAPIRLPDHSVPGVVTVSGASEDMPTDKVDRLVTDVRQAASAIAQRYRHT